MAQGALSDPILLALSFAWLACILLATEAARRFFKLRPAESRKLLHVLAAAWVLPHALLFESVLWAASLPAACILLNAVSYRYRLVAAMEEEGRGSPGTIAFALSWTLLTLCLWHLDGGRAASVAGMAAMGLGDAAAWFVGRRGRRPLREGAVKTWEGTFAMFAASFPAILLGTWPFLEAPAWGASLAASVAAAAAEVPSPRGLDNLTVPLGAAAVFLIVRSAGG